MSSHSCPGQLYRSSESESEQNTALTVLLCLKTPGKKTTPSTKNTAETHRNAFDLGCARL